MNIEHMKAAFPLEGILVYLHKPLYAFRHRQNGTNMVEAYTSTKY